MKVSMDGLRKNLTQSFNEFIINIKATDIFENMDNSETEKLENVRAMIGSLNCCYDPDDKDDWKDLSDIHLEDVQEGEE